MPSSASNVAGRGSMLRRHLMTQHGLGVDQYRSQWKLRPDHPITAPSYSECRSTMARTIGLGNPASSSLEGRCTDGLIVNALGSDQIFLRRHLDERRIAPNREG